MNEILKSADLHSLRMPTGMYSGGEGTYAFRSGGGEASIFAVDGQAITTAIVPLDVQPLVYFMLDGQVESVQRDLTAISTLNADTITLCTKSEFNEIDSSYDVFTVDIQVDPGETITIQTDGSSHTYIFRDGEESNVSYTDTENFNDFEWTTSATGTYTFKIVGQPDFEDVTRIHVFGNGKADFSSSDFSVLPASTVVSCVNDSHERVTSMHVAVDTSLATDPSVDTEIALPFQEGYEYAVEVDWGDGYDVLKGAAPEANINDTEFDTTLRPFVHDYGTVYRGTVKIAGKMPRWAYGNQPDVYDDLGTVKTLSGKDRLVAVETWADLTWTAFSSAFHGCSQLLTSGVEMQYNSTAGEWETNGTVDPEAYKPEPVGDALRTFAVCTRYGDPTRVGTDCDIGDWDMSAVIRIGRNGVGSGTPFARRGFFWNCTNFNQPIGTWDTSGFLNVGGALADCEAFDQDLSGWDMSQCERFWDLFRSASNYSNAGQPLDWDMSSAVITLRMFFGTNFNQRISPAGDFSSLVNAIGMLRNTPFNQNVSGWQVPNLEIATEMFSGTPFNNGLPAGQAGTWTWNTPNLRVTSAMFSNSNAFNQNINGWDWSSLEVAGSAFQGMFHNNDAYQNGGVGIDWNTTDALTTLSGFIRNAAYNQPINLDETSSVTNIWAFAADNTAFNQDMSWFDASSLQDMREAFQGAVSFNNGNAPGVAGTLTWDTPNLTQIAGRPEGAFQNAESFNCDISGFDVSGVTDFAFLCRGALLFNNGGQSLNPWAEDFQAGQSYTFAGMLNRTEYNEPLDAWGPAIGDMTTANFSGFLFTVTQFDQSLETWDIRPVTSFLNCFSNSGFSQANWSKTIAGFGRFDESEYQDSLRDNFSTPVASGIDEVDLTATDAQGNTAEAGYNTLFGPPAENTSVLSGVDGHSIRNTQGTVQGPDITIDRTGPNTLTITLDRDTGGPYSIFQGDDNGGEYAELVTGLTAADFPYAVTGLTPSTVYWHLIYDETGNVPGRGYRLNTPGS